MCIGIGIWVLRRYNPVMFVRKNRNRSGSISVQIVSKANGRYRVIQTLGSTSDPDELSMLLLKAENILRPVVKEQQRLFAAESFEALRTKVFLEKIENANIHTVGPELIFGTLFDRIGFGIIPGKLFRHLVIARLAYPGSKLKTVDYIRRYRGEEIAVDTVYRFLDRLNKEYKAKVEKVAYQYTQKRLKTVSVVFYDMTTLYFEAEAEDDLRKIGFSKDGKFQCPQIMIGLLVGKNGYPIGYDIFEGNTFEGHTLLPILDQIRKKYRFPKPVVIADAGLLSNENLKNLVAQSYQFIIGGRLKNESEKMKEEVLKKAAGMQDGESFMLKKKDGLKILITYSSQRAKKDAHNRERGVKKLRQRVKSGKLTKENISNRGYNKFLRLIGKTAVEIDEGKIVTDQKWDGLKEYVTNTKLSAKSVVENYRHLWQIEKAFRISKSDLRVRPIFHRLRRRIEAHICIAFVAYTIYKELERLLHKNKVGFSPQRGAELTHNMYELDCILPGEHMPTQLLLKMDPEQQKLFCACRKS